MFAYLLVFLHPFPIIDSLLPDYDISRNFYYKDETFRILKSFKRNNKIRLDYSLKNGYFNGRYLNQAI